MNELKNNKRVVVKFNVDRKDIRFLPKKDSKIEIRYRPDVYTESGLVIPDGYSSITFRNIGSDNATIMDNIPLDPGDPDLVLENDVYSKIVEKIRITFANNSAVKKVLVIKKYQNLP